MRLLRITVVAVVIAFSLLFRPSAASAQIDQVTVRDAVLGLEGASVTVLLEVQCDPGWNLAFGNVSLAQATGHRLASGFGSFSNPFPGTPCTGGPQVVAFTVQAEPPVAFKKGDAALSGEVFLFNPSTSQLVSEEFGPLSVEIRSK
jgi:hypothetical protein